MEKAIRLFTSLGLLLTAFGGMLKELNIYREKNEVSSTTANVAPNGDDTV